MDPLAGIANGWTGYRYAFDNPLYYSDPTGLWEFKINKEESGNFSLSLVKTSENDNWRTLRRQTGLSKSQLKKTFGKGFKSTLNKVDFDGGSIPANEINGKMGETLAGIEQGLNDYNPILNTLFTIGAKPANNCWGTCISTSLNNKINPFGIIDEAKTFDERLYDDFENVSNPKFGDVIRYALEYDPNNIATHGSLFLIQNERGTQIFTKNGSSNNAYYQVMYEQQMLNMYNGKNSNGVRYADYGQPRGKSNQTEYDTPFYSPIK